MLRKEIKINLDTSKIFDYGISIEKNQFKFFENYCIIPTPLVLFYTIACAISGKSKSIAITGVDGYSFGDERNELTNNLFKIMNEKISNPTNEDNNEK